MKLFKAYAGVVIMLAALFVQQALAAPFAKNVEFTQPNGQRIELWGEGDDFHAVFETLDGYTVYLDKVAKAYFYATLNADGTELVSTGVMVGEQRPANIDPHIRIDQTTAMSKAHERQRIWEEQTGLRKRWESLKKERRTLEYDLRNGPILMAPPSHTTVGEIVGIVLLIDFEDDPRTITREEINNYCNQPGYTGYGNNGSVRDYYQDGSNGLLLYTNVITTYVTIPNSLHPKSYYTDAARDAGVSANELIHDALNILTAQPNYASEIAPMIDQATINNAGQALAMNVFYAGGNGGAWAQGLWPHMWGLYDDGAYQLTARTAAFTYQITNMGNDLTIGTFCHENGHMICGYPDLYDYDYDSIGGAGKFCLMGSAGSGKNPSQISAYLKYASGWTTTVDVDPISYVQASVSGVLGMDEFNRVYKLTKPNATNEYYLFEGRRKVDRDAALPGEGVLIWHVDELGDRDDQRYAYNALHRNYECALVQADGYHHFERNLNAGDINDPWYADNSSPNYANIFKDTTTPSARWWDGSRSLIVVRDFSSIDDVMTFTFLPPTPLMLSAPGALPFGREWDPYSYGIGQINGVGTMQWSVITGSLPEGLTLGTTTGIISGVPTQATVAFFDVEVMTVYNISATNSFSLEILPVHTTPYTETFDNNNGAIPDSWRQVYITNSLAWRIEQQRHVAYPSKAHTPTNMICFYSETDSNRVTRLVTPRIDFGEDSRAGRLSFMHYMHEWIGSQDTLLVYYKTELSAEWTLLATYASHVENWTERVIDLPSISRSVYIAFEGTAKHGHGVCLDTLKVWDPTPPYAFVTENPLPNAIIDESYTTLLQVEGGYEPYTFSIVSNSLPLGMTLTPTGLISGTAIEVQHVDIGIKVVDDQGNVLIATYALTVTMPVVPLYEENFEKGGQMPYGWTQEYIGYNTSWIMNDGGHVRHPASAQDGGYNAMLFSADTDPNTQLRRTHTTRLVSPRIDLGQAPENIKLYFWHCMEQFGNDLDDLTVSYRAAANDPWIDLATYTVNTPVWTQRAVVLPNPTSTYYISFKGRARFGYGVCVDNIRITDESSAPIITTERALPDGLININYQVQMVAKGGIQPYQWALAGSTLPAGLSLSSNGLLSGQPQATFNGDFFVQVIGLDGFASTNRFNLKVKAVQGIPYTQDFENGGLMPDGWSQQLMKGTTPWKFASGTTSTSSSRSPKSAYSGRWNAVLFAKGAPGPDTCMLISPMLDMGGGVTNATLKFRHHMEEWNDDQDTLHVFYRTSLTAPWQLLQSYLFNTSAWIERTIALPNPSSTYFIAFEGRAQYGQGICIDDVSINGDVPSPYNDWLQADDKFTEQEIEDGLITGLYDNPDGDQFLNIWEYAFDLNPRVFEASGAPTGGVFDNYLQLTYRQSKAATDLSFVVEACTDLVLGDWTTNDVSELFRYDLGGYWSVTMRHDVSVTNAPRRFMRLKLIIN